MSLRENDDALFTASLDVSGFDCEASEISETLGIEPAMSWKRGDPVSPGDQIVHHENGWSVVAPDTMEDTAEAQVVALCKLIEPSTERFARLPSGTKVRAVVLEWRDADEAGGRIPSQCIARLASIGAEVVFMSFSLP